MILSFTVYSLTFYYKSKVIFLERCYMYKIWKVLIYSRILLKLKLVFVKLMIAAYLKRIYSKEEIKACIRIM